MDLIFKCSHCDQELSVDASAAGAEIQCPSCNGNIQVPQAESAAPPPPPSPPPSGGPPPPPSGPKIMNAMASSAGAKEEKHFKVPQHDTAEGPLIAKPLPPLEVAAKEGIRIRVRCIRHSDCVEVGKDRFEETVTEFLNKVGESNVISISPINYSHQELATRAWVIDFGVMVVYRM